MSFRRFYYILFLSSISFQSCAETYFGVLRGNEIIQYKSPYAGIINLHVKNVGDVDKNKNLFEIESFEYQAKIDIINIKIRRLRDLQEKKDAISETELNIKELKTEKKALIHLLQSGNISMERDFIIRDIYVSQRQAVNTGDSLIKVETLNKYHIDIKFDPVAIKGRIQDKDIKLKSLVNGFSCSGNVVKITSASSDGNSSSPGLKIATIELNTPDVDMSTLLDTAFEIIVSD
ncbi:hypothetical protein ACS0TE_26490 [Escherichia coli]